MKNFLKSILGKKDRSDSEPKGSIISEAMFSNAYDLSTNHEELVFRIHPEKRKAFDGLSSTTPFIETNGQIVKINGILLVVNSKNGNVEIPYSKISHLENSTITSTETVTGFDNKGEPLIYKMKDGTIRIVFFQLPPEVSSEFENFNLDEFSGKFVEAIGCGMWHDDREIFHIPEPKENTTTEVQKFLKDYRSIGK